MPPREWRLRVQDILEAIGSIRQYTAGLTFEVFVSQDDLPPLVPLLRAVLLEEEP